jgi:transposase
MKSTSEVLVGLVVGHKRDGRCQYDPKVKQELVRRSMQPGASVARMAMQHGVNANLLRVWIAKAQSQSQSETATAQTTVSREVTNALGISSSFVPMRIQTPRASCTHRAAAGVQVRLPNGVQLELGDRGEARLDELKVLIQMLSALPCLR